MGGEGLRKEWSWAKAPHPLPNFSRIKPPIFITVHQFGTILWEARDNSVLVWLGNEHCEDNTRGKSVLQGTLWLP